MKAAWLVPIINELDHGLGVSHELILNSGKGFKLRRQGTCAGWCNFGRIHNSRKIGAVRLERQSRYCAANFLRNNGDLCNRSKTCVHFAWR